MYVDQAVDAIEGPRDAPKSTMFEDLALDDEARLQLSQDRLALALALLLRAHRAAREDDVVARAVELDDLREDGLAEELVQIGDGGRTSRQRGGHEATHPEVHDQAALDDLDHGAGDRLASDSATASMRRRARSKRARFLESSSIRRPSGSSLTTDDGVDLFPDHNLVVRIDRLADRQLVVEDDAFALVPDVDQNFVLVDPDDLAGDDVALFEEHDRRAVVGDDTRLDLEERSVGAGDDAGVVCDRDRAFAGLGLWHFGDEVCAHSYLPGSVEVEDAPAPAQAISATVYGDLS